MDRYTEPKQEEMGNGVDLGCSCELDTSIYTTWSMGWRKYYGGCLHLPLLISLVMKRKKKHADTFRSMFR